MLVSRIAGRSLRRALLTAALLVIPACSEPTAPQPASEWLVFLSMRDNPTSTAKTEAIYRVNPDGRELTRLSPTGQLARLDVTPDGRTLVFEAEWVTGYGTCPQLWSMSTGDWHLQQLTTTGCNRNPRISPDGTRIAYDREGKTYVASLDGTSEREITAAIPPIQPTPCGAVPKWELRNESWLSLDRVQVMRYICQGGTTYYSADANGTGIVEMGLYAGSSHLSRDGGRIAYIGGPTSISPGSLIVRNADETHDIVVAPAAALVDRYSQEVNPWSPESGWIVYQRGGSYRMIRPDGSGERALAVSTGWWFGGWSADGAHLLFTVPVQWTTWPYTSDLHLVAVDGSSDVNLTNGTSVNEEPVWVRRN